MKKELFRPGVAMLELIFAIVVIAIVLMSAPMLVSTATKSSNVAIQQESINEAATQLNIILGYHWDENDTDENYIDPVLHVTNGDTNLSEIPGTGRRLGTPIESQRAFVREDGRSFFASNILGSEGGDRDDIDDFNGTTSLREIQPSAGNNYIETTTVNIATTVNYISDAPVATSGTYANPGADNKLLFVPDLAGTAVASTNIKRITVTLTSTSGEADLNKTIVLHAFSCNIGGYKLEERRF